MPHSYAMHFDSRFVWKEQTTWEILHFFHHLPLDFSTMNCNAKELWRICLNKICASSTKKSREKIFKVHNLFRILPQTWMNTIERLYLSPLTLLSIPVIPVIFLSYWNLLLCACAELSHFYSCLQFGFYRFCSSISFSSYFLFPFFAVKDNRVKHFICAVSVLYTSFCVCSSKCYTKQKYNVLTVCRSMTFHMDSIIHAKSNHKSIA